MDASDVSKLKVHELRAELGKRGLDTFGTKQILMDRLNEVLAPANSSDSNETTKVPGLGDNDEPPCITSPLQSRGAQDRTETNDSLSSHGRMEQDHKRRRSPSPRFHDGRQSPQRRRSRSPQDKTFSQEANDWEQSTNVLLDTYNSDLNLMIDPPGFSAKPLTKDGFSLMWAGVRANYGVKAGKAYFEARHVANLPVENLDTLSGGAAHVLRVGWSTENAEFALGEEPQSYGYGGTAKKSCDNKFGDYGCTFGEGDVVGAFLEWTNTEAILRFSVNGVDQGECYRVQKRQLGDRYSLFPHIYVKNVEFALNFGQEDQPPWFPPNIPGDDSSTWTSINNLELNSRQRGRMPPPSKADCEVIMMVGLPGSGKTYWAEHYRAEHKEKQYNVLGTNLILDKMKVMGLGRRRNYHGRWDALIEKSTKCLNVLISLASSRRRNCILDQTNVYPSAQRRKMRPFEGFKRKATVIVPTDEEFRRRIAQREKEEGKEVPESAVLEMKANFGIPKPVSEDPSSVFDEVVFIELNSDEAEKLVRQYNQEGQANRPPPEKRQRWDGPSGRERDVSGSRDSRFRGGYESRDRGRDFTRDRRDNYQRSPDNRDDRGRRGDYRGGYSASRDRSRENERFDRGPGSRDREFYGRPPPTGRFGGPRGPGPGSRFAGPPSRGGFPPGMSGPGGYGGGYGGPQRGGPMMGGGRGGPNRGGFGAPPGYGGPPMDTDGNGAPPRGGMPPRVGRGAFRGGTGERGVGQDTYNGPPDGMYPPSRFDGAANQVDQMEAYPHGMVGSGPPAAVAPPSGPANIPYDSAPGGGYRGGYGGAGVPRGGGPTTAGPSRGGAPTRGSMGRGGSAPSSQQFSMPPDSSVQYPYAGGHEAYGASGRGRYSRGGEAPMPYPTGTRGAYPGTRRDTGYPGSGYDSYPSAPPESDYTLSTAHDPSARMKSSRSNFSTDKSMADETSSDRRPVGENVSLYASAAGRYGGEGRPATGGEACSRQSRFDSAPAQGAPGGPYASYPPTGGSYQSPYPGGYSAQMNAPPGAQSGGPVGGAGSRSGRSRFDVGPGGNQPPPPPPPGAPGSASGQTQQTQAAPRPQSTTVQPSSQTQKATMSADAYGYGYGMPQSGSDSQPQPTQQSGSTQSMYGGYGYGYGYGQGYGAQGSQHQSSSSTATSLYASAVAEKPQAPPVPTTTASPTVAAATDPSAAAAYASYYAYGSAPSAPAASGPKHDAAMAAAQQFNAWQQNQPRAATGTSSGAASQQSSSGGTVAPSAPTTQAAAAASYASYYPGYPGYAYYGAASGTPATALNTGAMPTTTTASAMPQYYAGYR